MNGADIAIAGGGISGLTAATALAAQGHRVALYEAATAWGDVGAGITLSPNAMRGLDHIGLAERVAASGTEPTTQVISHWADGRTLLEVDRSDSRERYGAPYVYIHRADLHALLVEAADAAGVALSLDKRLDALRGGSTGPELRFADGSGARCDLLIGADGLKSVVREGFDPRPPRFSGHIAFRALAPFSDALLPLVEQPGMHIGPGKMVVRYPLRQGSLLNLVFFARLDGWTEDGWSIPATRDELAALFADWCDDVATLIEGLDTATLFKWAINAHEPLPTWSRSADTVLIGDAAHAMTPFLGQGAATGIEDAIVLARAVDGASTQREALQRYEQARQERCAFIQRESNANADRLQGPEAELYGVGKLRNEETLGLFAYDCRSVAL